MNEQLDKLKYPIGQFEYGKSYDLDDTRKHIKVLSKFPKELKSVIKKLKSGELEKTYRPGGWTVRQVINHLADSHINAYTRFKLAVTENTPIIKPYEESLWAELEDGKHGSVKTSLKLLNALHERWTDFLKSLEEDDLEKGYYHPASKKTVLLQEAIALYVWHSQHHLAHIMLVIDGKSKIAKKTAEENTSATAEASDSKSAAPDQAPKKRTISDEHREKIRAAQVARHAKNEGNAQPAAETDDAPKAKRGRKPGVKTAVSQPVTTTTPDATAADAPKRRGRKPGVKAAATTTDDAPKAKRGRKPGVKAAATTTDDAPKAKRGRKPGVKAAATTTDDAPKAKRGRKPGVKAAAASATADQPAKRTRRTKSEMEAARNGVTPVAPAKAATPAAEGAPKRRGLSPEKMAEIRALRGSKKAAESDEAPVKTPKAPKVAKTAAPAADGAPKRRGLSPEKMAEIRALRGTKKASESDEAPVETPNALKVAKAAAPAAEAAPKRRGLSPEKMAEIRAKRGTKKAAESDEAPVKAPKVAEAAAPAVEGAPKKRGLSPEKMAEIRAKRGTKKAAESDEAPVKTPKAPKVAKAAVPAADGAPKKRGLSPEKMAEIRAMRKKKE